jgi:hypothetical protein
VARRTRVEAKIMIKTSVAAGRTIVVDGWEIVAVESTMCAAASIAGRLTATATREPVAIIVRYPEGDRAFDLQGQEIPLAR